ncbi:molecular chaperone GroEL [Sinorhizobium fredii USDA 205]|uniref:Chaperonin GroEL n=1 Tax=Rhizobium fredii TaxID=380 RepID=A0A844A4N1_RHIFR|nr:chaperonin GroEL [Sinorhizobium fredii]ASY71626.1 Heat shock protein 60 family chaperone GroEL [Sinorhizobium fredii CCBAU 83666]KSV86170.1 molecular chaperone GroEL [Sinorhizobium fredii USDA 205]MQX07457.1 chaperonin GroEL [Sinorhizobium fredii]GEC33681.1 60 kDa chaperonin 3 [Sinorhizobium fredii]GLS06786.1 60 kDa chaperonin 3 [Sinorhizobium fredii]
MTAKDIRLGFQARDSMLHGIDTLARAVAVTLGPRGRNVAIHRPFGTKITKDGVSVAREIELEDRFEDMGVQLLRQVAVRTSYQAGDGTTTAVILADAILRGGVRAVAAGMNPMDVKRGIDRAVEAVGAALQQNARPVASDNEIKQVATNSANGDQEIGQIIAEAMARIGYDGVIMIEEGRSLETETEITTGIQFDRSYISPYFVTDRNKMWVEMEDAFVLVCEKKLSSLGEILPLLEQVLQADKPLLIIAEEIEAEVRAALIVNRLRGGLKVAAVKAPAYGELRKAILQDIALLTGGTVISEDLGLKLETISLDDLGRAQKIRIDKQHTTIAEGGGSSAEITARIAAIKAQLELPTSDFDREKLQERLARLSTGIAVVRVGGATESEVREKKDRLRNAMHATRAAVEEGILPGGGVALLRASKAIQTLKAGNPDQQAGIDIVKEALTWPAKQIASNAGEDGSVVAARILQSDDYGRGYEAQAGIFCDLLVAGIVDPAKVVRTALLGAASMAGLMIMTEAIVAEVPGPPPPELPGHHDHEDNLDIEF